MDSRNGGAFGYRGFAASPLTTGQIVQGAANDGDLATNGFTVVAAGSSAGLGPANQGTSTALARSDHDHTSFTTMSWLLSGSLTAAVPPSTYTIPEDVTNITILDFRVVADTPASSGSSTFNIERCTGGCTGTSPTFANIWSSNLTLAAGTRTASEGTAANQNLTGLAAGDQFKSNVVTAGTSLKNVTFIMTLKYNTSN